MLKNQLSRLFWIVLIVALSAGSVILLTRFLGGPSLAINQITTSKQSTFDVSGESKIATIPDQANVNLGLTVNELTVKAAQDKANQVINAINSKLGEMGIEKKHIKTENYSLYPSYDYQSGDGRRITGYSVNATLTVTLTDFAKLNQAIDMATQAGANQIGGINFTLSDKKKAEVEDQARAEAINNAKDKASTLARLAGMRLGKIVNVSEAPQQSREIYPMVAMAAKDGVGGGAPTNVEPGSTTFSYQVTLSYETL